MTEDVKSLECPFCGTRKFTVRNAYPDEEASWIVEAKHAATCLLIDFRSPFAESREAAIARWIPKPPPEAGQ